MAGSITTKPVFQVYRGSKLHYIYVTSTEKESYELIVTYCEDVEQVYFFSNQVAFISENVSLINENAKDG